MKLLHSIFDYISFLLGLGIESWFELLKEYVDVF